MTSKSRNYLHADENIKHQKCRFSKLMCLSHLDHKGLAKDFIGQLINQLCC